MLQGKFAKGSTSVLGGGNNYYRVVYTATFQNHVSRFILVVTYAFLTTYIDGYTCICICIIYMLCYP